MPNYVVQADVVDVTTDTPRSSDVFWVDTNVWFWMTYGRFHLRALDSQPRAYQIRKYPSFVKNGIRTGAQFHWLGLSLSELARQIEDAEREIAETTRQITPRTGAKAFRHDYPALRRAVVQEVESCWRQVEQFGSPLPAAPIIDATAVNNALTDMQAMPLDAYDLFAVRAIRASSITQVLTDDGDFCTVPGITLFTANRPVIEAARNQGKLVQR
ncbi:MAG: hypothetical protein U1F71_11010 [Verrucomicrobiaceae bacterium]